MGGGVCNCLIMLIGERERGRGGGIWIVREDMEEVGDDMQGKNVEENGKWRGMIRKGISRKKKKT